MKENGRIAVVGNGCAGAECILALRQNGYHGEIHLFTDGDRPIYNPMLTTYYVSGKISFNSLFPYGSKDEFYKNNKVSVHEGSPVVHLDAEARMVENQAGFALNYDQCLIATGALPYLPPVSGSGADKVYTMRTIDDALKLRQALQQKPKKALVVGASMVGIKMAELFYQQGMEVCLADQAPHIFPLAAHPDCALIIEERLRQMGINFRLNACLSCIDDKPQGINADFKDSSQREEAELLAMCLGVRTNTNFINRKQVEMGEGVLVDEYMRTNMPGLYAAGDVAEGKNLLTGDYQIIGLWANARYQGRTAGRNMAGNHETFPGSISHNITHFMGMDFVGIGNVHEYDKMEKDFDGKRFIQLFWTGELLTGANFVDVYEGTGAVKAALIKGLLHQKRLAGQAMPLLQNLLIKNVLKEVQIS